MSTPPDLWDLLDSSFQKPTTVPLEAVQVPSPFRELLVHTESMTQILESAYGEELRLRIVRQELSGSILFRQVFLVRPSDDKPVAIGLVSIHLNHLAEGERQQVVSGEQPLGKLLQIWGVQYSNRPSAFFHVVSNGLIGEALGLPGFHDLYGRGNRLLLSSGQTLAEVIEILAPFDPHRTPGRGSSLRP